MIPIVLIYLISGSFAAALVPSNYRQPQTQYQQQPNYQPQATYSSSTNNKQFIPIVSESNELNPDGSFSYSYVSGDGSQAQAQGYLKNPGQKDAEAEVIQGAYSYTAPDGTPISVNWIADEYGFRAEGAHLPTPPPIPPEIQKALAQIAQAQAQPSQSQQTQYRPNNNVYAGQSNNNNAFQRPSNRPTYRF